MVVIDDANQMKNASPEILLETAQDVVTNLVHHSKLFNESSEIDNIPRFSRSDIVTGRILGRGGFCTVKEIKSIKAEEKMPSNFSSGQPKSRGFPFLRKSDTLDHSIRSSDGIGIPPKQFMAYRCSRGGTKYYVLKQVAEDLVYQDRITFLKGVVDLVLESQYLASLSHPNIVEIRGLSDQSPFSQGYFIVVDRLKETLPSKLKQWMTIDRQCKGITGVFAGGKKKQDGLLVDRMKAAYGVANALSYIHSLNVVYRDLKPGNIGFDRKNNIRIFDFGLAKELSEEIELENGLYKLTGFTGSLRYMAPEVGLRRPYNQKVDVYSFSMLLWYIMALEPPYGFYTPEMLVSRVFQQGHRPVTLDAWPQDLCVLMKQCWDEKSEVRPNFQEIMEVIKHIVADCNPELAQGLSPYHTKEKLTVVCPENGATN